MPRTKEDRRRKNLIHEWDTAATVAEIRANNYRRAAAILQGQGRDLDALLLDDLATAEIRIVHHARDIRDRLLDGSL